MAGPPLLWTGLPREILGPSASQAAVWLWYKGRCKPDFVERSNAKVNSGRYSCVVFHVECAS